MGSPTRLKEPLHLNLFEVVLLVGACLLVKSVTVDARTNWAEGWIFVSFYIMIARSFSICLRFVLLGDQAKINRAGTVGVVLPWEKFGAHDECV